MMYIQIRCDMLPGVLSDFQVEEIEERLIEVFNGYLGADTGATPDELQTNQYLIHSIIKHFKRSEYEKLKNNCNFAEH